MNFKKTVLGVLILGLSGSFAHATSELDSEIDGLQVQIIRRKPQPPRQKVKPPAKRTTYVATPVANQSYSSNSVKTYSAPPYHTAVPAPTKTSAPTPYHRHATLVADNPPIPAFEPTDSYGSNGGAQYSKPSITYVQKENQRQTKLISKIELIPALSVSSFDGTGSGSLNPSGSANQYNFSPSGFLLADINFGFYNLVLETGFMVAQLGSVTGDGYPGSAQTITAEKVTTTYFGVPLNAKWMFSGEGNSSFYLKGGAIPVMMMGHAYSSNGVNFENRFGGYNTFDLLFDAGLGYDLRLGSSFHVVAEVSGFQGIFPVLTNFDAYNFGILTGIGLGYVF